MYLEYNPPQMLPTTTLHPSADSSSAAPRRVKREVAGEEVEEQGVDAGSVLIAGVAVSTLGVVLWGVVEAWWKRG